MQQGSAARDYSMQCDRPSHLLRVMKGRGCHSALAWSHMARSSLLLALESAAHMMHSQRLIVLQIKFLQQAEKQGKHASELTHKLSLSGV